MTVLILDLFCVHVVLHLYATYYWGPLMVWQDVLASHETCAAHHTVIDSTIIGTAYWAMWW